MLYILYIPGLGDNKALDLQKKLINRWPKKHTITFIFDSLWHTPEEAEAKYKRLLQFFTSLPVTSNDKLVCIGVSAGGPLALRLCSENLQQFTTCYLVVGKLKGAASIGNAYLTKAPALQKTVQTSEKILEQPLKDLLRKCIVVRPLLDLLIPLPDMTVPTVTTHKLPVIGHTIAIGYALRFYFPRVLKKQ